MSNVLLAVLAQKKKKKVGGNFLKPFVSKKEKKKYTEACLPMKHFYKEFGIRDVSFNASVPLSLRGALLKLCSALKGVVMGASGPAAAFCIT